MTGGAPRMQGPGVLDSAGASMGLLCEWWNSRFLLTVRASSPWLRLSRCVHARYSRASQVSSLCVSAQSSGASLFVLASLFPLEAPFPLTK